MPIANYINEVNKRFKTGISREHSYRGDLQTLLETLVPDIIATNEPARIDCGAPDYVITKKDIPLGYIEAKDLDDNLDDKSHKEQFDRYRNSLNNLIITNYLEFRFYRDGEQVTIVRIGHIENGKVVANTENFQTFNDLIVNFCAYRGQTISSAAKLAKMMAGKARLLADVIKNALNSDDNSYDNRTLQDQMTAFQKILISDISKEEFADVYAQTIAYGMFAGRLNDTSLENFSRQEACECIPKSNPFLRNLFSYIAGPTLDDRIKWIVDDLADVFVAVNLHDILKDFGKATKTQDPIIHFYETFLSEYDPKLRKSRGVWYTPQPVVNFIVRAVDDILKQEFKLSEGLADTSKVTISVKDSKYGTTKKGDKLAIIKKDVHRVQILDPATGTGTFLAEVIRQIHEKFIPMQGMWSSYVEQHLLPRVHGFEILMASYAMAHLKLDLILKETGYKATKNDRLKVYLTNSLEEPHPDSGTLFASWLSQEAEEANEVKREVPVMVVLGNPPYSGESSNKGEWITSLIDVYKQEPTGGRLQEKNPKWINDDYVKFIRYAEQFIEKNNTGVLAYINNHSFLDNPTFRGMRWHLLNTFDKIYILDLHGNAKKKETCPDGSKDENVFDIQQGVSINLFIKTDNKRKGQLAEVYHYDLYGKRESKYEFLAEHSLNNIDFNKLEHQAPYYFFVKRDFGLSKKYDKGFGMTELFKLNNVGIVTARDNLTIHDTPAEVINTVKDFAYLDVEVARHKYKLGKDVRDWTVAWAQRDLIEAQISLEKVTPINYRPFDTKYTYYTGNSKGFHCYPRWDTMKHFINRNNLGLLLCKQFKAFPEYHHVFVCKNCFESSVVSNKTSEISYGFPLYIYEDLDNSRHPNFNSEIIKKFADGLKLKFMEEKTAEQDTFAPIDVLDYIYAVLHSPKYRETYKEFLKIDFPKVPYPTDKAKFWKLVKLGSELRSIHLLESDKLNTLTIGYPVSGDNIVTKLSYEEGKVYINDKQYFDKVPEVAWNFYIGGYQPAQKWLKDRKNKELTYDDIMHYQKIINALYLTDKLMLQIDEIGVI